MGKFNIGDLVKIKQGTHQHGMPKHRTGLVLGTSPTSKAYTSFYEISFIGIDLVLKFHEMFLEQVTPSDTELDK